MAVHLEEEFGVAVVPQRAPGACLDWRAEDDVPWSSVVELCETLPEARSHADEGGCEYPPRGFEEPPWRAVMGCHRSSSAVDEGMLQSSARPEDFLFGQLHAPPY